MAKLQECMALAQQLMGQEGAEAESPEAAPQSPGSIDELKKIAMMQKLQGQR